MSKKHVAVLMGGFSSERTVSLLSGGACADALERKGYRVSRVDVDRHVGQVLEDLRPDVAFNALHGPFGEDGKIQGVLEYLQVPYTHSGVMASALAMDKARAKVVAASADVWVAPSKVLNRFDFGAEHPMKPPYVVKPVSEGSSFGVVVVRQGQACPSAFVQSAQWHYGDEVMVEKYVAGRELTCAIVNGVALDVCEILPGDGFRFYDYEAKYSTGGSKHVCPAQLLPNIYQNVKRMSLAAHRAIGCRGVSRSDFRFDEEKNELMWLEINTQPGMTPTSLVPDVAENSGYSFDDLVEWIVEDASCMR